MPYPRFSLKITLYGITICCVVFIILGQAVRGEIWAMAICLSILAFFAHFLFHAVFYGLNSILSRWVGGFELPARTIQGGLQSAADAYAMNNDEEKGEDV